MKGRGAGQLQQSTAGGAKHSPRELHPGSSPCGLTCGAAAAAVVAARILHLLIAAHLGLLLPLLYHRYLPRRVQVPRRHFGSGRRRRLLEGEQRVHAAAQRRKLCEPGALLLAVPALLPPRPFLLALCCSTSSARRCLLACSLLE